MANNWNEVRYTLDQSSNFSAIYNSPWYSDAVYDKFSEAEYQRRYEHARRIMVREGLQALLLTGAPNFFAHSDAVTWATGLEDARGMCQYVILPLDGEPTLVYPHPGCHIEAARQMVSISDVRGSEGGQYGKVIADRLKELGIEEGTIGVTAADRHGPEYMGLKCYQDLVKLLPNASFKFLPHIHHEMTAIKSDEEVEAMDRAAELAVDAFEAVLATARPGVFEYQLAAAGTYAILNGGGLTHLMMIGSTSMHDPKMVFPNPIPSQRVLKKGDIILTEIVAQYKGYYAKIGHPITVGPPTAEAKSFYQEIVLGGYRALEAQLMPGKSLEDVRKAGSYFREKGAQSRPIMVHGVDLLTSLPYINIDRIVALPGDEIIRPGNTYCIEITPINAEGTFGMFLARTTLITEDGQRDIINYPLDELAVADGG